MDDRPPLTPAERAKLMKEMDMNLEAILTRHLQTSRSKNNDENDTLLVEDVRSFFGAQFSSETMLATIDSAQYQPILMDIVMGLHELLYIKHFSYFLEGRDVLMTECRSLAVFLLSKIKDGRMYDLQETDLKTRNPTIMPAPLR